MRDSAGPDKLHRKLRDRTATIVHRPLTLEQAGKEASEINPILVAKAAAFCPEKVTNDVNGYPGRVVAMLERHEDLLDVKRPLVAIPVGRMRLGDRRGLCFALNADSRHALRDARRKFIALAAGPSHVRVRGIVRLGKVWALF